MVWFLVILRRVFSATFEWLKKQWRWVVVGAAILISFLLGRRLLTEWLSKGGGPVGETDAEREARSRIEKIQQEEAQARKEIEEEASERRGEELEAERESVSNIADDTQAVNDYLRELSEEMRKR